MKIDIEKKELPGQSRREPRTLMLAGCIVTGIHKQLSSRARVVGWEGRGTSGTANDVSSFSRHEKEDRYSHRA
ncbi:MAG TPA: hypothetical protein VHL58_17715, partial [Thermoanaerobaculia bacterium]|nr:hypothetical protein [Thermoanaerobaculia bacterium]